MRKRGPKKKISWIEGVLSGLGNIVYVYVCHVPEFEADPSISEANI